MKLQHRDKGVMVFEPALCKELQRSIIKDLPEKVGDAVTPGGGRPPALKVKGAGEHDLVPQMAIMHHVQYKRHLVQHRTAICSPNTVADHLHMQKRSDSCQQASCCGDI